MTRIREEEEEEEVDTEKISAFVVFTV